MPQAHPVDRLTWMRQGTTIFTDALAGIGDDTLARPTALPGWTGAHLLAHVAANAEALGNLAGWASTGLEKPMYASAQQRNRDIEEGATRPARALRKWVLSSADALDRALTGLSDQQWNHPIRTAQGRRVTATEIPWMRAREVMVHSVDLGSTRFDDLPETFLVALVDDITGRRAGRSGPALIVHATGSGRTWQVAGDGEPATITGTLPDIAAWLAGRPAPRVSEQPGAPVLPAWL